jgi:phage terminase small subunit
MPRSEPRTPRTRAATLPDPDAAVEREQRRPATRRMSTGDRQSAELAAAMRARTTGQPVFPYPAELREIHKSYWLETVNSKPHDYFNAGDVHLLKLYCRVAADIDRLDGEIEREGSVVLNMRGNPVVNPRILVRSIAETRLLSLSTKLRLQPAARYDSDGERNQNAKKKKADASVRAIDDDGDDLLATGMH